MKIVVTGSEGSLMQAVIPHLLAAGHTILGIDNLYRYGKKSKRAGIDYEFVQQDLIDRGRVFELTQGADAIIHAAAKLYGVLGLLNYRADILGDDTAICSNILQACVTNNIPHVVYMSSSMVYDSCIQDINVPLSEAMTDTCPLPKTDYGLSKLVCERMVEAFRQQYGINYTVWRPFNIVSPHEESMAEIGFSHVLPDFVNHIVIKKLNPLPIIGNGEQIRCFTWIDDVANIIANYSFLPASSNQVFNVCNVEPITMKNAARMIYQATGKDPADLEFITSKEYVHDVKIRIPTVEKLQTKLGPFKFASTKESIAQCIQHLL
jgi:nucleoside-diphosphate-sugar epimerase